jgi:hypothetical protein
VGEGVAGFAVGEGLAVGEIGTAVGDGVPVGPGVSGTVAEGVGVAASSPVQATETTQRTTRDARRARTAMGTLPAGNRDGTKLQDYDR